MAFVVRTYQCDSAGTADPHRFEVMLASGEHPKFCPECGMAVDADVKPIPSRIAIGGSAIGRATDQTYRLIETSSAARAAELNAPYMKVTDMNDRLREGDVAAKAPVNAVTSFAAETKLNLGIDYMKWGGGYGRVAPAMTGGSPGQTFAGPGHVALKALQPDHEARVQEIVSRPTYQPYRG